MLDVSARSDLTQQQSDLVQEVYKFTRGYFQNPKFDASHDFDHVLRVTSNALYILDLERKSCEPSVPSSLDTFTVILGALLHDVDDKKYINATAGELPHAQRELLRLGLSADAARRIQSLIEGVSYSSEVKDPSYVQEVIDKIQ